MSQHDVASLCELSIGGIHPVEAAGRRLLVCRTEDAVFAVAERCPHAAWSLASGTLTSSQIVCDLHGARFALADGRPTAGPTDKRLETFPVTIRGDRVLVSLEPRAPAPA